MKIGKGWAPEPKEDEVLQFANRELRMLLKNIFEQGKGIRLNANKPR